MGAVVHRVYAQIFKVWRSKRMELFIQRLRPQPGETLLDVGGYPAIWTAQPPRVARIDTINPHVVAGDGASHPDHHIRALEGDGCALPFPDQSYDIVFSNSVIEHVGTWERQQRFAQEARRVGRRLWVQTPAFACPIEPHYLAPAVHWLPLGLRRFVVKWLTPRAWLTGPGSRELDEMVNTTRLLTYREMRQLFPDCEIHVERMLGCLPKSYIAIRGT
jgi:hypothetical protein